MGFFAQCKGCIVKPLSLKTKFKHLPSFLTQSLRVSHCRCHPTWNISLYSLQSCYNVISCHSPGTPSVSIFQSVNGFVFFADFWKSHKNVGKMDVQKSVFFKQLPRFFLGTLKLEDHHLRYTSPPKTPKHLFSYCFCYFCSFCMESQHSPSQIQMFVFQLQLKYHLLSEDFSHNCFFPSPLPQTEWFHPILWASITSYSFIYS